MALTYHSHYFIRSLVPVSTSSMALVDDVQAIQNFTTTEPLIALVVYNACNYHGDVEDREGKRVGINIDGADEARMAQSPFTGTYKNAGTVICLKELVVGPHTIKGRFSRHDAPVVTVTIHERQLAIFLFKGTGTDYHYIRSTTGVTTNSTILVDDVQAIQDFSIPSDMLMLVLYCAGNWRGAIEHTNGKKVGIMVDGADKARQDQGPRTDGSADSASVWHMEVLSAGDHTVKGRFAANAVATVSINERQLAILLFSQDQLYDFVRSTTPVTTTLTSKVDDTQAIVARNLPDTRQTLILYTECAYQGDAEWNYGKKVGIMVDGVDYSQSRQSSRLNGKNAASAVYATELLAGLHTIKGRFASNTPGQTNTVHERQLAILYFLLAPVGPHKQNILQKMMHGGL